MKDMMYDPAGFVNLEELDEISNLNGSGDVDPQSVMQTIAWTLISIISFESTVTAFSSIIEC